LITYSTIGTVQLLTMEGKEEGQATELVSNLLPYSIGCRTGILLVPVISDLEI